MKPIFWLPFYSVSIILLLVAGCLQKAPAAEEKSPARQPDSLSSSRHPLWLAAGKKEGLTQQQTDSLQNIILLRKKF